MLCTLPDPRPVKYAMLDQKGVLLWPTPDPKSVKALPSHITRPRVTWVWATGGVSIHALRAICCVDMITRSGKASRPPSGYRSWLVGYVKPDLKRYALATWSRSWSQSFHGIAQRFGSFLELCCLRRWLSPSLAPSLLSLNLYHTHPPPSHTPNSTLPRQHFPHRLSDG